MKSLKSKGVDALERIKAILQRGLVKLLAGTFALAIIGNLLQLAVAVILSRRLGVEGFGLFIFAYGVATLVAILAPLGWHTLVVRFIPQYLHDQNAGAMRSLLRSGYLVGIGMPLLVLCVATVLGLAIAPESPLTWALIWGCALGPVTAMHTYQRRALSAIDAPASGLFYDGVVTHGGALLAILLFPTQDYKVALMAYFAFGIVAVIASEVHFRKRLPMDLKGAVSTPKWGEWLKYSLPATLGFSVRIFINKTDVLMLPPLSSLTQVGLYGAAFKLTYVLTFPQTVVSTVIAPKIAAAFAARDSRLLRRRFAVAFGFAVATTLPVAAIMFIFAEAIMLIIFGSEYVEGARTLQLLTIAQLTTALTIPTASLLLMAGGEHKYSWISMVGLAANFGLNLALIPYFGAVGAATATLVSSASIFVLQAVFAWPILSKPLPEREDANPSANPASA